MNYPKVKRLSQLSGYLFQLTYQGQLFEMEKREKTLWNKRVKELTGKIKKLEIEIEKFKVNKVHRRRGSTEAQRILFIPPVHSGCVKSNLLGAFLAKIDSIKHIQGL